MPSSLTRPDFLRLLEIVESHPEFRTEQGRWSLIDRAFGAVERGSAARRGLNLAGATGQAATALVTRLDSFGRLGDRHSLALVLEVIRADSGADLHPDLDRLIAVLDGQRTATPDQRAGTILHLSDLHFGTLADARNWHSQLAEDLRRELDCDRLDGLICSGDLATVSTDADYAAAVAFLTRLKDTFGLAPERIVLVPGNHDLNWDLARAAYAPGDPAVYAAAGDDEQGRWIVAGGVFQVRDEARYRRRFDLFSARCYQPMQGTPYPDDYPEQFSFHHWAHLGLLVLGLNSAWAIDHHHRDRADIHPEAISQALDQLHNRPDWAGCLKIAVWHHPLNSGEPSRITDHGFLERLALAGFRLGLHGHIHRAEIGQYRYDQSPGGRRLDLLAAGTFGALSRDWVPGYPLQYQLLRLTPAGAGRRLTVATRRRAAPNGAWQPDACWLQGPGQDPLPRYTVDL
jgi:3',5'-cyclic AMP phosphodiesterase CpdA